MSKPAKTLSIKVTAAFGMGGKILMPGKVLHEVPEAQAKNLLERGRVELYTGEESDEDTAPALEDMTLEELRAEAEDYQIEGADKMNKKAVIAAIREAEEAA
jgi:hypothetical protein